MHPPAHCIDASEAPHVPRAAVERIFAGKIFGPINKLG
jgi:hypothetical protein